jgi:hypothetical protein
LYYARREPDNQKYNIQQLCWSKVLSLSSGYEPSNSQIEFSRNNLTENAVGIEVAGWIIGSKISSPNITSNSIYGNSIYNLQLVKSSKDTTVADNWRGTNDNNTLGLTIYDDKDDDNLGVVTFTPYST